MRPFLERRFKIHPRDAEARSADPLHRLLGPEQHGLGPAREMIAFVGRAREMDALQTENERLRGDRAEAAELLTDGITRALQDAIVRLRPAAARPEITREPSFS